MDLEHIAAYWKETAEKDKRSLIEQFVVVVAKEFSMDQPESQAGGAYAIYRNTYKVPPSKHGAMSYSLSIKDRTTASYSQQEQPDYELKWIVDKALKAGAELELIRELVYSSF